MKKTYMRPTIRVVELSHSYCLLAGSAKGSPNIYDMSVEPIKTFTGGDETIGDEDEEDII